MYLDRSVAPIAARIDQESEVLGDALQGLGDRQLLALKVPQELGGAGLTAQDYALATIKIAAASGILAFLQTQHQSAASQIAQFGNAAQKALLPQMATGQVKIGVGFSHLRRRGKPLLKAIPHQQGFLLTGFIPWITGYGFFQRAIAGATLPNGDELYALIPLENAAQINGGTIDCGKPLPLAAMGASRTVAVTMHHWQIEPADVLVIKPAGSIEKGDRQQVLHHGFFAIGCAQGVINFLTKAECPETEDLQQDLAQLQAKMLAAIAPNAHEDFQHQLNLRLQAIHLAQHYAQIALTFAGGAGNLLHHPAQRLYREALMFSVFGQTQTIRNTTLKSLLTQKSSRYTKLQ